MTPSMACASRATVLVGLTVKQGIFRTRGALPRLHDAPGYLAGFLFHQALAAAIVLVYALGFRVLGATDHRWR